MRRYALMENSVPFPVIFKNSRLLRIPKKRKAQPLIMQIDHRMVRVTVIPVMGKHPEDQTGDLVLPDLQPFLIEFCLYVSDPLYDLSAGDCPADTEPETDHGERPDGPSETQREIRGGDAGSCPKNCSDHVYDTNHYCMGGRNKILDGDVKEMPDFLP